MRNSWRVENSGCYKYAQDVISGKILSGKLRIKACERFLKDLSRVSDPDYPWKLDVELGYRPIDFMEKFIKPSKGNYDKMALLPWQHFVEANLYGWVSKETGLRRFREAVIIVGAGNGKSTLITGNAAYAALLDGEPGAEVYMLANSRDQAKIIYNECKTQIENSPLLLRYFRTTQTTIYQDASNSIIKALATDSKNLDGLNVHLAIFDEEQDYVDYRLINRIEPKTKKREQPMVIYITTKGTVIDGPLMDHYMLGKDILEGKAAISEQATDRIFIYIDEIDDDDDPDNSDCWAKANPSLGHLLKIEDLKEEWEKSKPFPAKKSNFITRQLNVFTNVDELSFLDVDTIKKNNKTFDVRALEGMACYGGFDLAETEDFTSACCEFPFPGNEFFVLSHSWVPAKKLKEDKERLDWAGMVKEGLLTIVDGDYVDFSCVFDWFMEQKKKYRFVSVGYDRAKAHELINKMMQNGFAMEEVRQGELTLTAPLDNIKERFLDGNIIHNNNRLLNWYLGNVKLTKRGHNATYLPTKQHQNRKIDGFAALLNAHTEWLRKNPVQISPDKKLSTVIKLA